jgi:hypothetical protein
LRRRNKHAHEKKLKDRCACATLAAALRSSGIIGEFLMSYLVHGGDIEGRRPGIPVVLFSGN